VGFHTDTINDVVFAGTVMSYARGDVAGRAEVVVYARDRRRTGLPARLS
jgi:hypothetical protein